MGNFSRRNRKTKVCKRRRYKRKGAFNTRKISFRTTKRKLKGGGNETITEEELNNIINNLTIDTKQKQTIDNLKPKLKKLKFNENYVSCFTGKPIEHKNIAAMVADRLQCHFKYSDDIFDETDTFID